MNQTLDTKHVIRQMETLTEDYLRHLEGYTLEQLQRKPRDDDWSLGQMYLHLIGTATYMQLRNLELCREGSANPRVTGNGKSEPGQNVFAMGGFPPIQIKVPASPEYTPQQPESIDQIRNGLLAVLDKMRAVEPQVGAIPTEHTVDHPRLGGLNALEWFSLVEMHYRHHLRQRERLSQFLAG
jgi:hypothetical protein